MRRNLNSPFSTLNSQAALLADFAAYQHEGAASGVDPYLLFARIGDALHRHRSAALLGAPLRWYARTLEHWTNLLRTGRLHDLPEKDRHLILRHLRHNDLYAFGVGS